MELEAALLLPWLLLPSPLRVLLLPEVEVGLIFDSEAAADFPMPDLFCDWEEDAKTSSSLPSLSSSLYEAFGFHDAPLFSNDAIFEQFVLNLNIRTGKFNGTGLFPMICEQ